MRMNVLTELLLPAAVGALRRLPFGPRIATEVVVGVLANATAPRPRPFSLSGAYTSWPGLTDRTFTGRHLPPAAPGTVGQPPEREVVELFRRPPGQEVPSDDTSVLFMFFAQWFTDSFLRTDRRDPRRNTSTQEIDFCQIYGLDEARTRQLRALRGGRLASQLLDGQEYPPFLFTRSPDGAVQVKAEFAGLHDEAFLLDVLLRDVSETQKDLFFAVGLEHGNSTLGSTMLDVVFLREHNRIAAALEQAHREGTLRPSWDRSMTAEELDERLFQTTRNIMTVLLIKLVIEEYIRHIAPYDLPLELVPGMAEGKPWNRSNQIAVEFNLLYRWHALIPEQMSTDAGPVPAKDVLRDNNALLLEKGVEWVMTQSSRSRAGRLQLSNTPDWLVDRKHPDWPAVEERTVSLMRFARLAGYNDYRTQFGLSPVKDFAALTADPALQERLRQMYGDIDRLEWYVGIFAEDHPPGTFAGSLLTAMVGYDAFTQALTNPLLAARVFNAETFTEQGLSIIRKTTSLQQIAARNVTRPDQLLASFAWRPATPTEPLADWSVPGQRRKGTTKTAVEGGALTSTGTAAP